MKSSCMRELPEEKNVSRSIPRDRYGSFGSSSRATAAASSSDAGPLPGSTIRSATKVRKRSDADPPRTTVRSSPRTSLCTASAPSGTSTPAANAAAAATRGRRPCAATSGTSPSSTSTCPTGRA